MPVSDLCRVDVSLVLIRCLIWTVPLFHLCFKKTSVISNIFKICTWSSTNKFDFFRFNHYFPFADPLPTLCWAIILRVFLCLCLTCVELLPILRWTIMLLVPLLLLCAIVSLVLSHYVTCNGRPCAVPLSHLCWAITYLALDYNITSAIALALCHCLACVESLPHLQWSSLCCAIISLVLSHYLPCVGL